MRRSPQDCQKVLAAVIATYQDYLGDTYQNVSQETVQLITQASITNCSGTDIDAPSIRT